MSTPSEFFTISRVRDLTGLSMVTLTWIESELGDVLQVRRTTGGNRLFTPADVEHLKNIKRLMDEEGRSMAEAKALLFPDRFAASAPAAPAPTQSLAPAPAQSLAHAPTPARMPEPAPARMAEPTPARVTAPPPSAEPAPPPPRMTAPAPAMQPAVPPDDAMLAPIQSPATTLPPKAEQSDAPRTTDTVPGTPLDRYLAPEPTAPASFDSEVELASIPLANEAGRPEPEFEREFEPDSDREPEASTAARSEGAGSDAIDVLLETAEGLVRENRKLRQSIDQLGARCVRLEDALEHMARRGGRSWNPFRRD